MNNEYFKCDCGYYATSQEMLDSHQEYCLYGAQCVQCKDTIMTARGGVRQENGEIICDECFEQNAQEKESHAYDEFAPTGYELGLRGEI